MNFLHPIFTIPFIALIVFWHKNIDNELSKKDVKSIVVFIAIVLILAAGLRYYVGADYPVYKQLFNYSIPQFTTFEDVFDKAIFIPNAMELEWLYVFFNKVLFSVGLPFHYLTLVIAAISISLQFSTFYKYSYYPLFSILFYFMPLYFFADCGQMRQALGTAICIFSIRFIIKRNLLAFLLCMYLALGMHKTAIVFFPAYWIVLLPFNAKKWMYFLVAAIITSPLELYSYLGDLVTSISPQDVSNSYTGYLNDKYYGQELQAGIEDIIKFFLVIVAYRYDKKAEQKAHYYEYYRNLAFFGFCLYYVLRGNAIFATRLPAIYVVMMGYFVVPSIMYSVNTEAKKFLKLGFSMYLIAMYLVFSNLNGTRGKFVLGEYRTIFTK